MRGFHFRLLITLTSLAMVGQPIAQGSWKIGSDTPRTSVSFQLYRDYLIVVQGSVGPLNGLNFLLDTGATPSVLDARLAAKLHLNYAPTDVAVLSGSVPGGTATAPSVTLGPIRKDSIPVLVEDLSFLQKALPIHIDAMIGLDLLGASAFVIDYASREIRFGPAPSMPLSVRFQLQNGLAILDATVNHTAVHLLLDTGAPSLILFQEAAIPSPDGNPSPKPIGDSPRKPVRLSSFRLGEAEFGREPAYMVESRRDAGHAFDGLMSPAALGITQVAVDLGRGTLAFAREP